MFSYLLYTWKNIWVSVQLFVKYVDPLTGFEIVVYVIMYCIRYRKDVY